MPLRGWAGMKDIHVYRLLKLIMCYFRGMKPCSRPTHIRDVYLSASWRTRTNQLDAFHGTIRYHPHWERRKTSQCAIQYLISQLPTAVWQGLMISWTTKKQEKTVIVYLIASRRSDLRPRSVMDFILGMMKIHNISAPNAGFHVEFEPRWSMQWKEHHGKSDEALGVYPKSFCILDTEDGPDGQHRKVSGPPLNPSVLNVTNCI